MNMPKSQNDQKYEEKIREKLPKMATLKYNVVHFTSNGAEFIDGTQQNFTMVIYATGNNWSNVDLLNNH